MLTGSYNEDSLLTRSLWIGQHSSFILLWLSWFFFLIFNFVLKLRPIIVMREQKASWGQSTGWHPLNHPHLHSCVVETFLRKLPRLLKQPLTWWWQSLQNLVGPLWHLKILLETYLLLTSLNSQVWNQSPSQPPGSCSSSSPVLSQCFNHTTILHQRGLKNSFLVIGSRPHPTNLTYIPKLHRQWQMSTNSNRDCRLLQSRTDKERNIIT